MNWGLILSEHHLYLLSAQKWGMKESAQRRLLAWAAGSVEGPFTAGMEKQEKTCLGVGVAVMTESDLQNL